MGKMSADTTEKGSEKMNRRLIASMIAALGTCAALAVSRPVDDTTFMLDLCPELVGANGTLTSTAVGDRLRWSERDTVHGEENTPASGAAKISIRSEKWAMNMYPMTTNDIAYLYFPQSSWLGGNGYVAQAANRLKFDDFGISRLAAADAVTAHVRFKWEGPVQTSRNLALTVFAAGYDWGDQTGFYLSIINQPGSEGFQKFRMSVGGRVSQDFGRANSNLWYDVFTTVKANAADAAKSDVTVRIISFPGMTTRNGARVFAKAGMTALTFTLAAALNMSASHPELLLANENGGNGQFVYENTTGSLGNLNTFRGGIAALDFWARELTETECWQVASGHAGATWSVGGVNGSAGEFAVTDPGADYDVTNGWRFCRSTLTASTPTLRLKGPMTADDANLGHMLEIVPILAGLESPCRYDLTVCGTKVGTYNLARPSGRCVYIPAEYWMRDANGDVTVEITRVGNLSGIVTLDAIMLGGSWTLGLVDGNVEGYYEGYVLPRFVAGDQETQWHRGRALTAANPTQEVQFHMPYEGYGWEWGRTVEVRTQAMGSGLVGNMQLAAWLNGVLVDTNTGLGPNETVSFALPANLFVPGMNTVVFSNATPSAVSDNWCNVDFYRLTLEDHPADPEGTIWVIR